MNNELNIPNNNLEQTPLNPPASSDEKPKFPLCETIAAWIMFALGFVFTHFAFKYAGGVWGGIFWFLSGITGAVFVKAKKLSVSKGHVAVFVIAELFSLSPFFCANVFINFLSACFVFMLDFYLLITISGAELFGRHFVLDALQAVFVRPFMNFAKAFPAAFSVFRGKKHAKNILFVLLGLLLAVPLTLVAVGLLMSSDDVFGDFMMNIKYSLPHISFAIIPEIIFAIPVALYMSGALYSAEKNAPSYSMGEPEYRILPPIAGYVAVTPVCVFYLFYIGIQISRIFNSSLNTPSMLSDFARRGFFELVIIAVINLGVIVLMQTFTKRLNDDKKPKALKIYTVLLCLCTLGIITTALVKMIMYISALGMTPLRVYTSWFMILLAIIFVIVIVMQFKDFCCWKAIFISFAAMFAILCFGDIDGQIARYNISAYQSEAIKELDTEAFSELGYSALAPAVRLKESGYSSQTLNDYLMMMKRTDSYDDKFAYFSIPRLIGQIELYK